MKSTQLFNLVVITSALIFINSCTNQNKNEITITNTADVARTDELIVLKRSEAEAKIGTIPEGKYVIVTANNQPVLVQYDDLNADGKWDEMVFLSDFKPNEKINFSLSIAEAPATIKAVVKAHVRHRKKNTDNSFGEVITIDSMPQANPPTDFSKIPLPPYLTEGPAWENDKVAFRLYFDTRNGKDIFGKRLPGMVMDTIGANHNNSYHELSNWGMDLLHVGKSLGAGAVALQTKDVNGKDTLIRLGGPNVKSQMYQVVADGPIRAIFKIKYEWEINGKPVTIIDETSIWGGQYFYETKLSIVGTSADAKLVVGMANFYDNRPGQLDTLGTKMFYSYGAQSENKDNLGLAISVAATDFANYWQIKDTLTDIQNSYAVAEHINTSKPVVYRFYACWEKSDERFKTLAGFRSFLAKETELIKMPLSVQ